MNYTTFILLAIAVIIAVLVMSKGKAGDITIPEAPQRSGLYVGFYGCVPGQVAATKHFVNLHWETFWNGVSAALQDIKDADMHTLLDVDSLILSPRSSAPRSLLPDAEQRLRDLFDLMLVQGTLHQVKFITPTDEPQLPENNSSAILPECVELIQDVVSDYPELVGVEVTCIYYSDKPMDHQEIFGVVGFNQYEEKSRIFGPDGLYTKMRKKLWPDQRTWIVPGGSFRQDPQPFLNYANGHEEVLGIIFFTFGNPHKDSRFTAIRDMPEVLAQYEAVGLKVKGAV